VESGPRGPTTALWRIRPDFDPASDRIDADVLDAITGLEKRWLHSWALGSIASGGASLLTSLYIVQLGASPVGSADWRPRLR
jgi:hypothetical protein